MHCPAKLDFFPRVLAPCATISEEKIIDCQIENLVNEAFTFADSPPVKNKCSLKNSGQWVQKIRQEKYGAKFEIYVDFTEKTQRKQFDQGLLASFI